MSLLQVEPICSFTDNYIWVIKNGHSAIVVDPGESQPVLNFLHERNLELCAILITHHHIDHIGGIESLTTQWSSIPVYGPAYEAIPHITTKLYGGERIYVEQLGLTLDTIHVPGHTLGHIAYYSTIADLPRLFCGDTLFATGCGKLFEGTAAQMLTSLKTLTRLPAHTLVYCAHEYTLGNIQFALVVEPDNVALQKWASQATDLRRQNQPTLPTTIEHELRTNPFLRCKYPAVAVSVQRHTEHILDSELAIFTALRHWKNNFR